MNFTNMKISTRLFLTLLVLFSTISVAFTRNTKDYITWDDLKLHERGIEEGENGSNDGSRVIVVDRHGHGDSRTVQGAVDKVPEHNTKRIKIHILPGTYREKVHIPASKPYISFIGDVNRPKRTLITWHDKASDLDKYGNPYGTSRSASVSVESDYFCATGITFENTIIQNRSVNNYQAVAFRIAGDKAMFHKVRFIGSQDTLLDEKGSHYFYKCFIRGETDFIFGQAKSLYEECELSVGARGYAIAAHHRESPEEDTLFSFVRCNITNSRGPRSHNSVMLGRAWAEYSRVIYSYCLFDINISQGGWSDWNEQSRQKTAFFSAYNCTGKGAKIRNKAKWAKTLEYEEVKPFLNTTFINTDRWLRL